MCRRGVLVATSVRYWRGCKRLNPEDLGLDPSHVSERLIQLGHKRLIPRDALQAFALIESRVQATVGGSSFPFLGGIGSRQWVENQTTPAGVTHRREFSTHYSIFVNSYDQGIACTTTADTKLDCLKHLERLDEGMHHFCRSRQGVGDRTLASKSKSILSEQSPPH